MKTRATFVWFSILLAAIANGYVREAWLNPQLGTGPGHIASTLSLSIIVALVAGTTIRWMAPRTGSDAAAIGVQWLLLTLAFEFLAGHFLFGQPWSRLLEDYAIANGRIWVIVLIVTAVAPYAAARAHGVVSSTVAAR